MDQMGHHFWMGHVGHGPWVTASDRLTHDDEITSQYLAVFLFLVDIKKLLTHSVSPIIMTGDLF